MREKATFRKDAMDSSEEAKGSRQEWTFGISSHISLRVIKGQACVFAEKPLACSEEQVACIEKWS